MHKESNEYENITIREAKLAEYSTMRLGGIARNLVEVYNETELIEACKWADDNNLNIIPVGHGSNIVWRDEGCDDLVLVNKLKGRIFETRHNGRSTIRLAGGETWDDCVAEATDKKLSGIEALSAIPGTAGAAPVQNIGAYGQEISQTLDRVWAYDREYGRIRVITAAECEFGQRISRFKIREHGRFVISAVDLSLHETEMIPPFYDSLQNYLEINNITEKSPSSIRKAVIDIRKHKLPDPELLPNCGSYFVNPIISEKKLVEILQTFTNAPHVKVENGYKISAAWLIEMLGFKGRTDLKSGAGFYHDHSLILINHHANSTSELLEFTSRVQGLVAEAFGINLVQEPQLLP